MPKVKCKYCGKSIDKESSFKEEYLTDSLSIRYRYFCSEDCFNKKNEEKLSKQLLKNDDIMSIMSVNQTIKGVNNMLKSLNSVVLILIIL